MDDLLKELVISSLETKIGCPVTVTHEEWEDAKRDSLNDIYTNKLCYWEIVTPEYFANIMVSILCCARGTTI